MEPEKRNPALGGASDPFLIGSDRRKNTPSSDKRQDTLLSFFVSKCFETDRAEALLEEYGYRHEPFRLGYVGGGNVRISERYFEPDPEGNFMIVQGVWHDIPSMDNPLEEDELLLFDLIAWHPDKPRKCYFLRGEPGLILGEKAMSNALLVDKPLQLHRTPLGWLQSGCAGSVLLDTHSIGRLSGLQGEVICEDIEHAERIERGLGLYHKTNMPRLSVPAHKIKKPEYA